MKIKKKVIYVLLGLLFTNLFAMENRLDNFECVYLFDSDWKLQTKQFFSYKETEDTLNDMIYLMENAYVDFDEVEKRGFDKHAFLKNAENLFQKGDSITIEQLFDYVCKNLEPYVKDSHFNLFIENKQKSFSQQYLLYLSDTFVKKTETGYKVVKSTKLPEETELSLPDENVFKFISGKQELYRVGVLAPGENYGTKNLPVNVNNEKIKLSCSYYPERFETNEFQILETRNSVYINIPAFDLGAEHYQQFKDIGIKYRNKKNIIIDLRQNGGGYSDYYYNFLYDLYCKKWSQASADEFSGITSFKTKEIISPLTIQQMELDNDISRKNGLNPDDKIIEKLKESSGIIYSEKPVFESKQKSKSIYKGNLIFLVSKNTCSASEAMVINSKKLFKNVFIVGTNTNGMINFWNADFFRLKNSGILMQISERQLFLEYEVIEGKGILPDYVVSGNLEETIGFITKDKKILKGK